MTAEVSTPAPSDLESNTREVVLRAENLSRTFGNIRAVDDLSFTIRKGQVVGFIGANGAGKTTTMRILATLETADSGKIEILGYEATNYPDRIRPKLGWMPDNYGAYSNSDGGRLPGFLCSRLWTLWEDPKTAGSRDHGVYRPNQH